MLAELAVYEPFCFQALTQYAIKVVPSWKNRDADRMTLQDYQDIKKDELPSEWDPKKFVAPSLESRVKERFAQV